MNGRRTLFHGSSTAGSRTVLLASLTVLMAACATAPSFDTPDASFKGRVNVVETPVVVPGTDVKLAGRDFKPGQEIRLSYGGAALGGKQPVVVGADGTFSAQFTVPADAPVGQHPVVVNASKPAAALIHSLKVSPDVPLSGEDRFTLTSQPLVPGLYQVAYSAKNNVLFVTSAVGRPPVTQSQLVKVDAQTLAILANVAPPPAPAQPARDGQAPRDPGLYAVYGVGVDDVNGTVWVTNTRQNTVAVYRQSDLALLKQFEPGVVPHPFGVVVDEKQGKVYVSAARSAKIAVFDSKKLEFTKNIEIKTSITGPGMGNQQFAAMGTGLDPVNPTLYVVSANAEVAVIDTRTDEVQRVFPIEGSNSAFGVAFDPKTGRLVVASQGSDNLLIVEAASGKVLHDVKVGAGPLNVTVDSARGQAYVTNRGAGTVTVVSLDGEIVANLPGGTFPNHLVNDGKGTIYTVNKARGTDDPEGDQITRIVPR